jgi:hypothetical protein
VPLENTAKFVRIDAMHFNSLLTLLDIKTSQPSTKEKYKSLKKRTFPDVFLVVQPFISKVKP